VPIRQVLEAPCAVEEGFVGGREWVARPVIQRDFPDEFGAHGDVGGSFPGISPGSWREFLKPARATEHRLPIFVRLVELIQPKRSRFRRALAGRELLTGYRFAIGHLQGPFLTFLVIQESGASLVCSLLYIPGMMVSVKWAN